MRFIQFTNVSRADRKRYFNLIPQKSTLHLCFQLQMAAVACNDQFRDRAAITELAPPWSSIVGVGSDQAAFLVILASEIVTVEVTTVNRFRHRRLAIPV